MQLLIIDNYDSFTYNLVQVVRKITGHEPSVKRNDQFKMEDLSSFDKILLSPGPGIPQEAGLLLPLIKTYGSSKSIMGVCLGQQAIVEAYGGSLKKMDQVYHGVATKINVTAPDVIFKNLPSSFTVGRYHSWVAKKEIFPDVLQITSEDEHGNIMSVKHKSLDVRGVQFHPESIMTEHGTQIIANWIHHTS